MAFVQSFGSLFGAFALCLFTISLNIETCYSQNVNNVNNYGGENFGLDRAYTPDVGLLDFVYHNHEDMTKFLR